MSLDTFTKLYLDYVNNFLTVEGFAGYYGFPLDYAQQIVDIGRQIRNMTSPGDA